MNIKRFISVAVILVVIMACITTPNYAQKIGYVHSTKILSTFKDALDAQKKLDELNRQWEKEGLEMQKRLQELQDQFESQSLLLSESKKAEKAQEVQTLYLRIQTFQQEKWGPGRGQIYMKEKEFMEPVLEKINAAIKEIGDDDGFDYIFDTTNGNILYASDKQPDLTDRVLAKLEKVSSAK